MIDKIEILYNKTLRRIGPIHALSRVIAWKGGDFLVGALSRLLRFDLPPDKLMPLYKLEMLLGFYESETIRLCKQLIKPGMKVIDIGAHAGYYTFLLSHLVGKTGKVIALEPHPGTFQILERNVQRHGLKNVVLHRLAASNRKDTVTFFEAPLSVGHSLLPVKSYRNQLPVDVVSIDQLLSESEESDIDFIKLDVEGGEPEVLDGMRELVQRSNRLYIILEFKPSILRKRNYDPENLLKLLFDFGFDIFFIRNGGGLVRIGKTGTVNNFHSIEGRNILAQKLGTGVKSS